MIYILTYCLYIMSFFKYDVVNCLIRPITDGWYLVFTVMNCFDVNLKWRVFFSGVGAMCLG